jgi:hypothetical protein
MSSEKPAGEVKDELLDHIRCVADYWARLPDKTPKERCDGVAFSILTMIDGCSGGMPAFDLLVSPHEDDKKYNIDNGNDYYQPKMMINDCMLHDEFYK